ncbi:DUF5008 domain-containing protein [Niabella drilacis]|uniref:DUF5008 domain-containing protein n=1 Tax=Niabella drilacis (strain DSM 25811 / CCM 8410 / CCUG 62505 / LMG 26954 / E90) TaxID=1285928 RepID=A0A1G7B3Z1_NIADE|nr:DUF5008 domain-containing protein [Niabella drilacis]SDE21672.1 protein of unknown function [Niabella drilacis]
MMKHICFFLASLLLFFGSCKKEDVKATEVYPPSPLPLVKFLGDKPSPASGGAGIVTTFAVKGLDGKKGQFKFFINKMEAEVVAVREDAIDVKVPENASSGGSSILINNEYYFGPSFIVTGKVSIDPNFNPGAYRSNAPIRGIFSRRGYDNSLVVYGEFTDYKNAATANAAVSRIAVIDGNGDFVTGDERFELGKTGFDGPVTSVAETPDGKYLIAGTFSRCDTINNLGGLVIFTGRNGALERTSVDVINPDPDNHPEDSKALVPIFNAQLQSFGGGFLSGVTNLFYKENEGRYTYTAFGNFNRYASVLYERSTRYSYQYDYVISDQLVQMKHGGEFDSSFNYDPILKKGYEAGNGFVTDAIRLPDGSFIVVGSFTTFNKKRVNYITKIDPATGLVDESFNAGQAGADGAVSRITYNSTTHKMLLTGGFKNYNGQPANGVVMINEDGSVDSGFQLKAIDGTGISYAGQLRDGRVIISGGFSKYDGIVREGIAILKADGSLAPGCNAMGMFSGSISAILERPDVSGSKVLFIVGDFNRFDNKEVGNIVKIRIAP